MHGIAKKWWVLLGVGISSIIVTIDFTIVNTVLTQIRQEFGVDIDLLQWVMTGFGITFASALISMGRLADWIGRRKLLYIGIVGFGIASFIAGFSQTIVQLIAARVLQGLFGAIIFPCGMAITSQAFPPHQQGRAIGIYGSLLGIGLAIGPVLGGIITNISNWRWIFYMNIPIILVSLAICLAVVNESKAREKIPIEWSSMILIIFTLAAFIFAITQSEVYGWSSPIILGTLALSIVLFFVILYIEKHSKYPMLPPELFFNSAFFIGATVYSICVGLVWTIVFFVPLYLQGVYGFNELYTGLLLLPMTAMTVLAPGFAGVLYDKEGPKIATMIAFILMILGLFLFLFFAQGFSWALILVSFVAVGLSWGIGNGIAMPIVLANRANREKEALVSGAAITVLNIFGILVLSITSAIFHYVHQEYLSKGQTETQAFIAGFHNVNVVLLGLSILGFLAVLAAFRDAKFLKS